MVGLASAVLLRVSPSSVPDAVDGSASETPYLTRYIEYNLTPEAGLWQRRNDKHLDLAVDAANDKLLFQEAERPKVRRLRYLGSVSVRSRAGVRRRGGR